MWPSDWGWGGESVIFNYVLKIEEVGLQENTQMIALLILHAGKVF